MRWTTIALAAYFVLLTAALWVSDPFESAGVDGGGLRRFYAQYVSPVAHFVAFVPLAFLSLAVRGRPAEAARLGMLVSYAFLTEAVQFLVPGRTPEWRDVGQNLAGIAAGSAIWLLLTRRVGRSDPGT